MRFPKILCALWLAGLMLLLPLLAGAADFELEPWPTSRPLPALALADLEGQTQTLDTFKGRVLLVNFWASWCQPCREEMPALSALAQSLGPERLRVLSVNYQDSAPTLRRALQGMDSSPFVLLRDVDGQAAKQWTRRIFPTTVVVDLDGRPRWRITGQYDWGSAQARQLLAPLLPR